MSSGFSGGYPDFFTPNGGVRRSDFNFNQQADYRSRSDLIGKRSLFDFEFRQQQQQSLYSRNVKPKTNPFVSPSISNLNFTASERFDSYNQRTNTNPFVSPEVSSVSDLSFAASERFDSGRRRPPASQEMERKMLSRLQELEKELLSEDEGENENDAVSVVTDTEWSETIQKLLAPAKMNKPAPAPATAPSPTTSSSSSCASSTSTVSTKQLISDAAEAISDGKPELATEIITRLTQLSNARGTPEQRLGFYIGSALRSRINIIQLKMTSSSATELYRKEHILSTQLLYDKSPCFKLAFMAANDVILQALPASEKNVNIHVVDFDIGHGLQYVYLIHEIAAARAKARAAARGVAREDDDAIPASLKLTTFKDFGNGGVDRLNVVGDGLKTLANKLGVIFRYNVLDFKVSEISKHGLAVSDQETLVVNCGFKLSKLPDESVTTENLRDEVLRRVKAMSPAVVTLAEQEINTNTASFTTRVNEVCSYYASFLDSFDATISRDNPDRVRIEEGLSRRIVNSVACEGRERVERCEVLGKWRARMRMAGFDQKPLSQVTVESLKSKLNSGTRGNPGFSVKEEAEGVSIGWLGRSLTVVSAWR